MEGRACKRTGKGRKVQRKEGKRKGRGKSNARGPAAKADNDYRVGAPRHDAARRPELEKKKKKKKKKKKRA
jgi:hypothetical protein